VWLATRPARTLFGRNETLQTEKLVVRGILWRHTRLPCVRGGASDRRAGPMT
jgi:hypothetical protein